jgi:hypothetical protein
VLGGSAEVDAGDAGGGEAQGGAGGVSEAGEHVEGGQAAPLSMRAIEDWVVPVRRASSVWVSPARVRIVLTSSASCPARVAAA